MNRYLKAILLFDLAVPALLFGIPILGLFIALSCFVSYADAKKEEFEQHAQQAQQISVLRHQLEPVRDKLPMLKSVLAGADIEARLDRGISSALEKFSSDEIESTRRDVQPGPFPVQQTFGEGKRLALRFRGFWEPLTLAALNLETQQPNLFLESLALQKSQGGSQPNSSYLESDLSYFVITEN